MHTIRKVTPHNELTFVPDLEQRILAAFVIASGQLMLCAIVLTAQIELALLGVYNRIRDCCRDSLGRQEIMLLCAVEPIHGRV